MVARRTLMYSNGAARTTSQAEDDPGYGLRRCYSCGRGLFVNYFFQGRIDIACPKCRIVNVFESEDGSVPERGYAHPVIAALKEQIAELKELGRPRIIDAEAVFAALESRWEDYVKRSRKERAELAAGIRFAIFKRDGFRCRYCGRDVGDAVALHVDHVIPRSKGGTNALDNLVTSCSYCNLGKGANPL